MKYEDFKKLPRGDAFATGILPNSPEGIYMSDSGGELRWVAVKGYADDWAVYCSHSHCPVKIVAEHGDKIISKHHIKRCVDCDDEMFKHYRL